MPLHRRIPKRGFTNIFRKELRRASTSASSSSFPAGARSPRSCSSRPGSSRKLGDGLKILGDGS